MTTAAPPALAPTPAAPPRLTHPRLALAVICIAQLMVVLDATVVNVALKSIRDDLHFSATGLEWVITSYSLAFGGLLLFGGRTGDLFGRRRMFMIGVGLFAFASLLGGIAHGETTLVLARALQGIGGAIAAPTGLALIATTFAEGHERNKALGVYAAMAASGGAVGLLIGGVLTSYASWRWSLFINIPFALFVLFLAPRVLHESRGNGDRLDVPGAITATGGMTSLVFGITHAAQHGWSDQWTLIPLAAAVVLLSAFLVIERSAPAPLMPLHIFGARNRVGAYLIMLCLAAAMFAVFFFTTQYLQVVHGWSPVKTGVGFLPMPVTIMVLSMFAMRRLIPKVGLRRLLLVGPTFGTISMVLFSQVDEGSGYLGMLPALLCLAIGMGFTFVPLTISAVSGVHHHESGLASALLNTGQQLGGAVGLSILGTIGAHAGRDRAAVLAQQLGGKLDAAATHDVFVTSQQHAFQGAIVLAGLSLLASVLIMRDVRPPVPVHGEENIGAGLVTQD
jgi:EmrB/QacA subfamily drug resistance transporter